MNITVTPATEATPLCALMEKYGSDKGNVAGAAWHNYTRYYDPLFAPMRDAPARLFELGVYHGSSLRGWRDYFPEGEVTGADVNRDCLFNEPRIHTFLCDSMSRESVSALWRHPSLIDVQFDIMLDDGLHTFESNAAFFEQSFHKLRPGGVYIIEDLIEGDARYDEVVDKWHSSFQIADILALRLPSTTNTVDNKLLVIQKSA